MRESFPLRLKGFLGFAVGGLVGFALFSGNYAALGLLIGGAISGVFISVNKQRRLASIILAALGFGVGTLSGAFLISAAILGFYVVEDYRQVNMFPTIASLFIGGFTIIGIVGSAVSEPQVMSSRVIMGIKSFGLASILGTTLLLTLRLMGPIPSLLADAVVLLTYATAGGLYADRLQQSDDKTKESALSILRN